MIYIFFEDAVGGNSNSPTEKNVRPYGKVLVLVWRAKVVFQLPTTIGMSNRLQRQMCMYQSVE